MLYREDGDFIPHLILVGMIVIILVVDYITDRWKKRKK